MTQRVLAFHYELKNQQGETLDSSRRAGPLQVMEGNSGIIPGLEAELFNMKAGEKKQVHVPAARAYGPVDEKLKVKVNRAKLPEGELKVGMRFQAGPEPGGPVFTVIQIEGEAVSLDGNHPLAGRDLTFDVEVTVVREATAEELQHGHAHGPEGHHH